MLKFALLTFLAAAVLAKSEGLGAGDLMGVVLPAAFATAHGAACLDGTPPAYAIRHGNPNQWVLFLEGVRTRTGSIIWDKLFIISDPPTPTPHTTQNKKTGWLVL